MSAREYAYAVKGRRMTRTTAVNAYREAYGVSFMDALMAIDIAIGDINEGV